MELKLAGIDPALANFGLAYATYDTETGIVKPVRVSLVSTEKTKTKSIRKNSDDLRRASEHAKAVHDWIADANFVFAEVPTGSQSSRGSFSNGVCVGLLSTIGVVGPFRGKIIQLTPSEVKLAAVGSKHAAKSEMIEWAYNIDAELGWYFHGQKLQNKNEHMADALACIYAGIKTDEFINLKSVLASVT